MEVNFDISEDFNEGILIRSRFIINSKPFEVVKETKVETLEAIEAEEFDQTEKDYIKDYINQNY